MTKRYTFWRMPDGKPYKGKDGKHAPTALLAKIGESASVSPDRGISWPFPGLRQSELAVKSAVVVIDPSGNELNDDDAWSIVWKAVREEIVTNGGGTAILPNSLLQNADRLAAPHFRKSPKEYVLISSLSLDSLPTKTIRINDCTISALKKRGTKYPLPGALERRRRGEPFSKHLRATQYITIKVKTTGRTIREATDRAIDAVDLLRGLWTIPATYGQWTMRMGYAKREPIGVIHSGPVHTLHNPDGSLAADLFWYEPHYVGDQKLFEPKDRWKVIEKQRRRATQQLKRLPYRKDMEQLIIRFAGALDQPDPDVAFLRMWSILERITDTVGANYDETINRAMWVFEDRKVAKELLVHLRRHRNRYVHAAKSSDKGEEIAYMVKSFVEPHLVNLLCNDFAIGSVKEYGSFLALPTDLDTLTKRRAALDLAIQRRTQWGRLDE